jgi:hypothetical protein
VNQAEHTNLRPKNAPLLEVLRASGKQNLTSAFHCSFRLFEGYEIQGLSLRYQHFTMSPAPSGSTLCLFVQLSCRAIN